MATGELPAYDQWDIQMFMYLPRTICGKSFKTTQRLKTSSSKEVIFLPNTVTVDNALFFGINCAEQLGIERNNATHSIKTEK